MDALREHVGHRRREDEHHHSGNAGEQQPASKVREVTLDIHQALDSVVSADDRSAKDTNPRALVRDRRWANAATGGITRQQAAVREVDAGARDDVSDFDTAERLGRSVGVPERHRTRYVLRDDSGKGSRILSCRGSIAQRIDDAQTEHRHDERHSSHEKCRRHELLVNRQVREPAFHDGPPRTASARLRSCELIRRPAFRALSAWISKRTFPSRVFIAMMPPLSRKWSASPTVRTGRPAVAFRTEDASPLRALTNTT